MTALGADTNAHNAGHARVFYWDGDAWSQMGEPLGWSTASGELGTAVSLDGSGTVCAVSWDGYDASDGGGVQVFAFRGYSSWSLLGTIEGGGAHVGGNFRGDGAGGTSGVSLSTDGATIAVGFPWNDNAVGADAGRVIVYDFDPDDFDGFAPRGDPILGEAPSDFFGQSASLSGDGNVVVVGAPYNDDGPNSHLCGSVHVFEWAPGPGGGSWVQRGGDLVGEEWGDYLGWRVSISRDGSAVAAGAYGNDADTGHTGPLQYAGSTRVYDWDGAEYAQRGADIDGAAIYDQSGRSLGLSKDGSRVAISAYASDLSTTAINAGSVRVYEWGEPE